MIYKSLEGVISVSPSENNDLPDIYNVWEVEGIKMLQRLDRVFAAIPFGTEIPKGMKECSRKVDHAPLEKDGDRVYLEGNIFEVIPGLKYFQPHELDKLGILNVEASGHVVHYSPGRESYTVYEVNRSVYPARYTPIVSGIIGPDSEFHKKFLDGTFEFAEVVEGEHGNFLPPGGEVIWKDESSQIVVHLDYLKGKTFFQVEELLFREHLRIWSEGV